MDLTEVKEERPECTSKDGKHTWINYDSTDTRQCETCHYEEPIVYPREY